MVQIHDSQRPPGNGSMPGTGSSEDQSAGWAVGLRQLYKPVAEEAMPADFRNLLARIDRSAAAAPGRSRQ